MSESISRFCPSCGARVKAPEKAFLKPAKCPRCDKVVTFCDHPDATPMVTPVPPPSTKREPIDYAIMASLFSVPALAGTGLIMMVFGEHEISVLISTICLAASLLLFAKHGYMRSQITKLRAGSVEEKSLAEARSRDLSDAIEKYKDFEANFNRLISTRHEAAEKLEEESQRKLDTANERNNVIDRLGKRLLGDSVKWISAKLTPNNFTTSSERLRKVVDFCRKHEYTVSKSHENDLLDALREGFEEALRKQHAKEEQQRIKARIREEQRAEKEIEREMLRIESEKDAIEKALQSALKRAHDEHSEEVDALREKLRDAEERSQRAKSMAQQTKAGHVYVISNIGSFGEGVYKVGMTRRLEPLDRVKELGDASVPFPFDVHMMVSCNDAPSLENAIHKELRSNRMNKVNNRREFFRADLETIHRLVLENHGEVEYIAEPEALQYRESLGMSDEEFEFISEKIDELTSDDEEAFIED